MATSIRVWIITLFASQFPLALDLRGAEELRRTFDDAVAPFIKTYCVSCHGKKKPKAKLDLSVYATFDLIAKDHRGSKLVLER